MNIGVASSGFGRSRWAVARVRSRPYYLGHEVKVNSAFHTVGRETRWESGWEMTESCHQAPQGCYARPFEGVPRGF